MTKQIIKITDSRAVLKRRPVYVGHLPQNEQFKVEAGAEYEIHEKPPGDWKPPY